MTKRGKFWASVLLASLTVGTLWAWFELSSSGPTPPAVSRHERLVREELVTSPAEPEPDGREAQAARRPHPVTPIHQAMAERREIIAALAAALEGKHYEAARALLDEAEELDRADPGRVDPESATFQGAVRGYQLILDCAAARGASADGPQELPEQLLLRARKYLDQQRLAPRREVRRVCLEGRPFARRG